MAISARHVAIARSFCTSMLNLEWKKLQTCWTACLLLLLWILWRREFTWGGTSLEYVRCSLSLIKVQLSQYIHTYMHTYIPTYIPTYIVHTCMHTYIHTDTYIHACIHSSSGDAERQTKGPFIYLHDNGHWVGQTQHLQNRWTLSTHHVPGRML